MRDDSDEWGEPPLSEQAAAQQREATRPRREDALSRGVATPAAQVVAGSDADERDVQASSDQENQPHVQPGALQDEQAAADGVGEAATGAKRGRRGRRGRGGAKAGAAEPQPGAAPDKPASAAAGGTAIPIQITEPPVVNVVPAQGKAAPGISPLARGVLPTPAEASEKKPRTLYAGRRGKAAPKGRGADER